MIDRQALLLLVSLIDRLTAERGEAGCPMSMSSPQSPVWPELPEQVRTAVVRLVAALTSRAVLSGGETGGDRAGPVPGVGPEREQDSAGASGPAGGGVVRQSSRQQVLEHTESTRLQYALTIRWAGGHETTGTAVRPVGRMDQLSYFPRLLALITEVSAAGKTTRQIADRLNAGGLRPAKRTTRFEPAQVLHLINQHGIRLPAARRGPALPDPEYCRATPADLTPFFRKPVSSMIRTPRRSPRCSMA